MAAFCGCCGAEITDRAEACPVCKTPRHGMIPSGFSMNLAEDAGFCPEQPSAARTGREREKASLKADCQ